MYPTTLPAKTGWGGQIFNAIGKNATGAALHNTQSFSKSSSSQRCLVNANILAEDTKINITVLSYALYLPAIKKASQTEEVSNVIIEKFTNPQSTFALSQIANATSEDSGENIT
jgi:hypothetical protein